MMSRQQATQSIDSMQSSLLGDIASAILAKAPDDYLQTQIGELKGVARKVADRMRVIAKTPPDTAPVKEIDKAAQYFLAWAEQNLATPVSQARQNRDAAPTPAEEPDADEEEYFGR